MKTKKPSQAGTKNVVPANVPSEVTGDGDAVALLFARGHARPLHEQVGLRRRSLRELREELSKYGH